MALTIFRDAYHSTTKIVFNMSLCIGWREMNGERREKVILFNGHNIPASNYPLRILQ